MQTAYGSKVEVQIFRIELEPLCDQIDRLLELHQCDADVLDFPGRQCFLFDAPDRLSLHQFTDEFNQAQHELDDRPLNVFRFGIPP